MNKKRVLILISVVTGILLLLVIVVLANSYVEKKRATAAAKTLEDTRAEWGVDNQNSLAKSAVEAFLQQDSTETIISRKKRLSGFLTSDSPVLDYTPDVLSVAVVKSSAKATGVEYCEEQEGGDLCLIVKADVATLSPNSEENTIKLTYWLTIVKDSDNKFKVYDLGRWEDQ